MTMAPGQSVMVQRSQCVHVYKNWSRGEKTVNQRKSHTKAAKKIVAKVREILMIVKPVTVVEAEGEFPIL